MSRGLVSWRVEIQRLEYLDRARNRCGAASINIPTTIVTLTFALACLEANRNRGSTRTACLPHR